MRNTSAAKPMDHPEPLKAPSLQLEQINRTNNLNILLFKV